VAVVTWSAAGWWWLALPLLMLCMVMMHDGHTSHRARNGERPAQRTGGAERLLGERLVRGEIDNDEYESRVAALRSAAGLGRTEEVRHVA
jgi:putative membrane protein